MTINAATTCDRFRRYAGAPDLEYGMELEINHTLESLPLYKLGDSHFAAGGFTEQRMIFPRYSFGSMDELGSIVTLLTYDLWDAAGIGGKRDWKIGIG